MDLLKKLWGEGLSASQIAAELGGITRNAVIGKVHRLGLSGRAKTQAPASKPRRKNGGGQGAGSRPVQSQPQSRGATALKLDVEAIPQAKQEVEPVAELVPMAERATILTLTERTCKWPIGDPGSEDFYFCGRHSEPGVPYCPYHCRIAYQPVNDRRRDRKSARG
ncbi:GcrA cell cycle regulator [Polymorphum gilvum SL003B-26A1]|uniref:GcrA cell cycle regulator n=1 Tax=Polymorphum gilvum (strain LMG 25793 / CGMCC 1.9160 / SL003B-26A1) TaxID=991905 RepID=F2IY84_POLGS|nr:GcrA cell cycle regulator [Polymorphum gilvum SL003B-26A1]